MLHPDSKEFINRRNSLIQDAYFYLIDHGVSCPCGPNLVQSLAYNLMLLNKIVPQTRYHLNEEIWLEIIELILGGDYTPNMIYKKLIPPHKRTTNGYSIEAIKAFKNKKAKAEKAAQRNKDSYEFEPLF